MRLDDLVGELDAYFRVQEVREESWLPLLEQIYDEPYWQDYVEPAWEGWWKGLMVRGAAEPVRVATCVFPSDDLFARLEPGTFVFTEHPVDLADEPGFLPWSRESFERLRDQGISVYAVHWPLDVHPEVGPSLLCARAVGLTEIEPFFEGAAVIGDSALSLDELAGRISEFLGPEVPVRVSSRPHAHAGRVAVAAGGGAMREVLAEALERGCETYLTGNAATRCRLDFVQAGVREFNDLAAAHDVAVVDGTHYGTEKPPQLAMVDWFRGRGLGAEFLPDGPK